jgi:hypothetical protein
MPPSTLYYALEDLQSQKLVDLKPIRLTKLASDMLAMSAKPQTFDEDGGLIATVPAAVLM